VDGFLLGAAGGWLLISPAPWCEKLLLGFFFSFAGQRKAWDGRVVVAFKLSVCVSTCPLRNIIRAWLFARCVVRVVAFSHRGRVRRVRWSAS